jgi:hypothetical protein
MSSLFIIGNGFDLAHGLKTKYEDFHQYLKDTYPDASFDGYNTPEAQMMPDGGIKYDDVDAVGFIIEVISKAEPNGDEWNDLETSLGYLDLCEYLDNWFDDDDDNEWHEVYRNQDVAVNLVGAVLTITDYFAEWIDTIEIDDIPPISDFEKLIDKENDFFLTFNYTKTLELIYGVKNVCHIHGVQGGELLFGHGNDTDYTEDYMNRHIGAEDYLQDMQRQLRKDTTGAIKRNQPFFNSITNSVNKIYSFGFSFSKVDEVYMEEICRKLSTDNVTWFLNDFDDLAKRKEYKEIIKSCGFQGKFSTYHTSVASNRR